MYSNEYKFYTNKCTNLLLKTRDNNDKKKLLKIT